MILDTGDTHKQRAATDTLLSAKSSNQNRLFGSDCKNIVSYRLPDVALVASPTYGGRDVSHVIRENAEHQKPMQVWLRLGGRLESSQHNTFRARQSLLGAGNGPELGLD